MGGGALLKYLALSLVLALSSGAVSQTAPFPDRPPSDRPLVIAHRGASGERPEHTLASYERAIDQGADYVEPDLVPTSDGVLVARHENELSGTTDIADRPEFAARRTTRLIDGREVTGWFTEDFTLAELRSLRARERLPDLRTANTRFDGLYPIPTFAEILQLVAAKEVESGRRIGIYPEIKHPTYFAGIGHDLAALLLAQLRAAGREGADSLIFIQSFDLAPLCDLRGQTGTPLIFLAATDGGPTDRPGTTYAELLAEPDLATIAACADGIGVDLRLVLGAEGAPTGLVEDAHRAGLQVHGWTLRKENAFLPPAFRLGDDPAAAGDMRRLYGALMALGLDGVFTDDPVLLTGFMPANGEYQLLEGGHPSLPGVR